MPNGFDFVDQLFGGFIAFVYNTVETACRILVDPVRSPARLYRRCRDPHIRQISGLTCLSLASAALLLVVLPHMPSAHVAGIDLAAMLPTTEGQVRLAGLAPFLAGGIVAAIVIDGPIRLGLASRRLSHAARKSIAGRLAYALSFVPLALTVYTALAQLFSLDDRLRGAIPKDADGAISIILLGPMIILAIGSRALRAVGSHMHFGGSGHWSRTAAGRFTGLLCAVPLVVSLPAGAWVTATIIAHAAPRPTLPIEVVTADCTIVEGTAQAVLGLWTATPSPQPIAPQHWRIDLIDGRGRPLAALFAGGRDIVVPGHLLRLTTTVPLPPTLRPVTACRVTGAAAPRR